MKIINKIRDGYKDIILINIYLRFMICPRMLKPKEFIEINYRKYLLIWRERVIMKGIVIILIDLMFETF
jgi:hypothetical protein